MNCRRRAVLKRLSTGLALALSLMLPMATGASASGPTRTTNPFPSPPPIIPGLCGSAAGVEIIPLRDNEYNTIFSNAAGTPQLVITTGALSVRVVNLSNNKSLDVNIPGPGETTFQSDGTFSLTMEGPWLFIVFPGQKLSPRMFLNDGLMTATFDAAGNIQSLTIIGGYHQDLCAALA
jgi:hypothetical protein